MWRKTLTKLVKRAAGYARERLAGIGYPDREEDVDAVIQYAEVIRRT